MKEITKEDLIAFFRTQKSKYNPTHERLCLPIINRIYKKMMNGIRFEDIKVCGSLLIDGHHRYVSSLLADIEIGTVASAKTSATVEHNWIAVDFILEDWDTAAKIKYLNQLDSEFNNIPIEKIIEMTK